VLELINKILRAYKNARLNKQKMTIFEAEFIEIEMVFSFICVRTKRTEAWVRSEEDKPETGRKDGRIK
jgi:hypothetical protein